jgi:hypothetical protein
VPAENSEKNAARSTTLYIRNGAGMEDYFYIFAQRHFLYTGRCGQLGCLVDSDDQVDKYSVNRKNANRLLR